MNSEEPEEKIAIRRVKNIVMSVSLLVAGCLIYLTCRQEILFFSVMDKDILNVLKINVRYNGNIFTYFFLFCLPDSLWFMALLILQLQFYCKTNVASSILFWGSVLLPFFMEWLQYLNVIVGTFDIIDVGCYLVTFIIFSVLLKMKLI